jgi:hypothetical protein
MADHTESMMPPARPARISMAKTSYCSPFPQIAFSALSSGIEPRLTPSRKSKALAHVHFQKAVLKEGTIALHPC